MGMGTTSEDNNGRWLLGLGFGSGSGNVRAHAGFLFLFRSLAIVIMMGSKVSSRRTAQHACIRHSPSTAYYVWSRYGMTPSNVQRTSGQTRANDRDTQYVPRIRILGCGRTRARGLPVIIGKFGMRWIQRRTNGTSNMRLTGQLTAGPP